MSDNLVHGVKPMRFFFSCLIIFFLYGCESDSPSQNTTHESEVPIQKAASESVGETAIDPEWDPIASPKAAVGGNYTAWGGEFPKSLNVWLDNNSFSAQIMGLLFEGMYGLHSKTNETVGDLAASWEVSEDKKTYTVHIHPQAKWSDGKSILAEDVQFYFDVIMNKKNLTSLYRVSLKRFNRPELIGPKTFRISAKEAHWRNFWVVGGLVAFPKHVWENKDFNKQNFKFPVVSGPYEISELKKNRFVKIERRDNWWGRIKKYNRFKYNFETIRYRFMSDQNKVLEAFKKGDFDCYPIYTSAIWHKQTDFDQVKKNWVVRQRVFNREPMGFQGFSINMRRPKFQDMRVRKALAYLLNRKKIKEKLMYNEYMLLNSYYPDLYPDKQNPDFELIAFDPEKARALLQEAGWQVNSKGMLEKNGKPFVLSFLHHGPSFPHLNVYTEDLRAVGIDAKVELLSRSTYSKLIDNHDFDMAWNNWGASRLRDPEMMWHSDTADPIASSNITGFKNKEVDNLIEQQKTEMSLDKRNEILKKIDYILIQEMPYVLLWQANNSRLLYWNKFGTPEYVLDKFNREDSVIPYWWIDPVKERALKDARAAKKPLPAEPAIVKYQE